MSKHVAFRRAGVLSKASRRYRGHEQGLALVLTLFVVALVTILVLEYHFDAAVEIDLAVNYANDVQAYHLALAGVRFAQALLERDDPAGKQIQADLHSARGDQAVNQGKIPEGAEQYRQAITIYGSMPESSASLNMMETSSQG